MGQQSHKGCSLADHTGEHPHQRPSPKVQLWMDEDETGRNEDGTKHDNGPDLVRVGSVERINCCCVAVHSPGQLFEQEQCVAQGIGSVTGVLADHCDARRGSGGLAQSVQQSPGRNSSQQEESVDCIRLFELLNLIFE